MLLYSLLLVALLRLFFELLLLLPLLSCVCVRACDVLCICSYLCQHIGVFARRDCNGQPLLTPFCKNGCIGQKLPRQPFQLKQFHADQGHAVQSSCKSHRRPERTAASSRTCYIFRAAWHLRIASRGNVGKVLVQRLHAECFEFSGHPARQFIVRLLNMHNFLSKLQKSSSFRAEWLF